MRFGVFHELQLPKPWLPGEEAELFRQALRQVVLADQLGFDYVWQVEHHFLDEYSHSSAPEVFLAAAAAMTKRIRLGHGIRQVIANYNHPARTAEALATLDIVSEGRVDFGIGEGATRLELGGFHIPAREKRAMALEAAEQVANMMVLDPYPGFEGKSFSMPCRNVLPKPVQSPHPPMWMACTNRDTIKIAASIGVGALAFAFINPEEAHNWSKIYYDIIKSDQCQPIGHSVNANIAMVSAFSLHQDRAEAIARGQEGFEFFGFAQGKLVGEDTIPGRTQMWPEFLKRRSDANDALIAAGLARQQRQAKGIGTPADMRAHLHSLRDAGVDQVIMLQQAGRNKHEHICEALELFAAELMPEFKRDREEREAAKAKELAPYIEAALARKNWMQPLADQDIPVVRASVVIPPPVKAAT